MVVWVAAVAEVNTAMVSRNCMGPNTSEAKPPANISPEFLASAVGPA